MPETPASIIGGYFVGKGKRSGESRIVMPFHRQMFSCIDNWFIGALPEGKRNLAICIPPRHTKTTLARDIVEFGLAWFPDSKWIYTSYASQLAIDQTIKIRSAIDSQWYREWFRDMGTWSDETEGTQDHFKTAYGGEVYGVGAGGAVTGFGAGMKRNAFGGAIIIDDPLKADEARSETAREHLKNWFSGTLYSRRNYDKTPMLLIAQRLHPEDLVGHLKQAMPDEWYFLEIPAVAPGATDTIWPETFSYETAMRLKEIDPFSYYSQYQQEPIVPGGAIIKAEWWRYYDNFVAVDRKCDVKIITADTAYGVKDANDYSVFQCWGFEGNQRAYLLDQVRGKWGYEQLVQVACEFWKKHSATDPYDRVRPVYRMYIENKASGQSLVQQHDLFREKGINAFPWNPGQRDKVARVKECLPAIYAGRVILPDTPEASWVDDFIAECSAFSEDMSQTHDDQVDAMAMAILLCRGKLGGLSEQENSQEVA
jgi:predicted phage terminase large subunit-like protein